MNMLATKLHAGLRLGCAGATIAFGLAAAAPGALAQAYPSRPVKLIAPFGSGGSSDVICRDAANAMGTRLGGSFVVENRVGAGGLVANNAVKSAPPDGHTLLCSTSSITTEQAMRPNSGFDVARDLIPVAPLVQGYFGIFVNPELPVRSLKELVELVKKNPGKYNFASSGIGGAQHLATEKLLIATGMKMAHVPYGGGGETLLSTMRNETQLLVIDHSLGKPGAEAGKLRLLAIGAKERSPLFPNAPTSAEEGVPEWTPVFWTALFAPLGTDPAIVTKLSETAREHFSSAEAEKRYLERGYRPVWTSPEELRTRVRVEIDDWKKVIQTSGIKAP